jgi:hypothetical protein
MLTCFPSLLPDELVPYSPLARYADHMGYNKAKDIKLAAYGTERVNVSASRTNSLDLLLENLPPNHQITADHLLLNHTFYPLYVPFLSESRRSALKNAFTLSLVEFRNNANPDIYAIRYIKAGYFRSPPLFLQYCPECLLHDRNEYGEAYWHRLHQVPGVEVCLEHNVFLCSSRVSYPDIDIQLALPPQPGVHERGKWVDMNDEGHLFLVKSAENIRSLLENFYTPSLGTAQEQYKYALALRGIQIDRHSDINKAITDLFRRAFPAVVRKKIASTHAYYELTHFDDPSYKISPGYQVAMIMALGHTVEAFFNLPYKSAPFNEGAWSCLNPFCSNYRELCIDKLSWRKPDRNSSGTHVSIRCRCGFHYARRIATSFENVNPHKWDKIEQVGPVWLAGFMQLWCDSSLSVQEIAWRLDLTEAEIHMVAQKYGLNLTNRRSELKYLVESDER